EQSGFFSPEKLPYLIENNSRVAIEALLQLKSSPQIGKYLETLLTINDPERSQQSSTEPVNRMRSSMENREAAGLFRFLLNLQRDTISEDVLGDLNGGGDNNNNDGDNNGEHGANGDLGKCELS
ncbi:12954_t:CDS:2, partial [Acaulospora colombiana]